MVPAQPGHVVAMVTGGGSPGPGRLGACAGAGERRGALAGPSVSLDMALRRRQALRVCARLPDLFLLLLFRGELVCFRSWKVGCRGDGRRAGLSG
jgi:hypothetical protein